MADLTVAIIGSFDPDYLPHTATVDALHHAAARQRRVLLTRWIHPEALDPAPQALRGVHGIVLAPAPPRSHTRYIDDILGAIRTSRHSGLPLLGTGRGFLYTIIELARHVAGLRGATSTELADDPPVPVISELPKDHGWRDRSKLYENVTITPKPGTRLAALYGSTEPVAEPHRTVHGINPDYVATLGTAGLVFSATSGNDAIVRAVELPDHPFFVAVAFMPQIRSTAAQPHPLFLGLVEAAIKRRASEAV